MITEITFLDENGDHLQTIEEDDFPCSTGDIIWVGDNSDNDCIRDIRDKAFVVVRVIYHLDIHHREIEVHPYGGGF